MKHTLTLFSILLLALGLRAQNADAPAAIQWRTIEQAAKTEAKGNTKLYFVDFYTTWCGWCKKMDRDTFRDPLVAQILNTYYIPVKFDAEGSSAPAPR